MTLSKLVAKVNQLKPSEYDKDDITRWVNQVEFLAFDQVIGHADPMDPKLRPLLRPPEGLLRPLSNGNEEVSTETAESTGDETVSSTEGYTVLPGVDNSHVRPPVPEPWPYRPYDYSIDAERELVIPDQFSDAYFYYVSAKIDFQNMEIDRYNAEAQAFENEFQQYAKWFRRTYKPKEIRHETTFTGYPYPEKASPFRHIPWD